MQNNSENIIKKAIEGGYPEHTIYHLTKLDNFVQVLDPLFWQALGKACRWEGKKSECCDTEIKRYPKETPQPNGSFMPEWYDWCKECSEKCKVKQGKNPIEVGLKFHEINLTQSWNEAIAWLDELIKK